MAQQGYGALMHGRGQSMPGMMVNGLGPNGNVALMGMAAGAAGGAPSQHGAPWRGIGPVAAASGMAAGQHPAYQHEQGRHAHAPNGMGAYGTGNAAYAALMHGRGMASAPGVAAGVGAGQPQNGYAANGRAAAANPHNGQQPAGFNGAGPSGSIAGRPQGAIVQAIRADVLRYR